MANAPRKLTVPPAPAAHADARPASALTVQMVADRYGVSPDTVRAWIASAELRAFSVSRKAGGRPSWRVSESALIEFELSRGGAPAQAARPARRKRPTDVIAFY